MKQVSLKAENAKKKWYVSLNNDEFLKSGDYVINGNIPIKLAK